MLDSRSVSKRIVDFSTGLTDPASFPTEELAEASARAIRSVGEGFVHYPGPLGHEGLRQVLAARESTREGFDVDPDQLALTNGSMQAVTLVGRALMRRPGDVIVTEELTYSGTISAYRGLGARLVGVPVDDEGMRIDELERTLERLQRQRTPPAFVYTQPTYQNPTAAVMPVERRRALLEATRKFGVTVVEDNCYADVHFEGEVPPSLYSLEPSDRIVYICSLSKIFAAGLRLGYLCARPPMLERIVEQRFDCGHSVLAASVAASYLEGSLWSHVETHNAALVKKRDVLVESLQANLAGTCSWLRPVGGLFLWLALPRDTDLDLLEELATEEGVLFMRGRSFHIDDEDVPCIRLAFGYPEREEIARGVEILARCIHQAVNRADRRALS